MAEYSVEKDGRITDRLFPIALEPALDIDSLLENDSEAAANLKLELSLADNVLFETLTSLLDGWGIPDDIADDYSEGYAVAFKLFQKQAEHVGVTLPLAQVEILEPYFENLDVSGISGSEFFQTKVGAMEAAEDNIGEMIRTHLARGEDEVTMERTFAFTFGFVSLYDLVKHQSEAVDFSRTFEL